LFICRGLGRLAPQYYGDKTTWEKMQWQRKLKGKIVIADKYDVNKFDDKMNILRT